MCSVTYKRCFPTRAAAASVRFDGMRPYRCEACGEWHLGHRNPRIVAGELAADRERADRATGVDRFVVRVCPSCGGEGMVGMFLHTRDCRLSDADPASFPRRRRAS